MTAFIAIGSVMTLAALTFVVWPLLSRGRPSGPRWPGIAIAVVVVPLLAAVLYPLLSNWNWGQPPADGAAAAMEMVARLEERMKTDPRDIDGWVLLGRSYFQLGRYQDSVQAYQQAYNLTRGNHLEAVIGLGEAMAFADETALTGPAAELFEQAFVLSPHDPKALWYSGLAAFQNGNSAIVRERWGALIALEPPPEVKQVLQAKLAEIDGQQVEAAAPTDGGGVHVRVALAPALRGKAPANAPLFVMARPQGQTRGPPLAVKKLSAAQLPVTVQLTDRDAMAGGKPLSGEKNVTVIARVAASGSPQARSGDLEGRIDVAVGQPVIDLLIDSTVR